MRFRTYFITRLTELLIYIHTATFGDILEVDWHVCLAAETSRLPMAEISCDTSSSCPLPLDAVEMCLCVCSPKYKYLFVLPALRTAPRHKKIDPADTLWYFS